MMGVKYTGTGSFSVCSKDLGSGDRLMLADVRETGCPAQLLEVLAARDDFEPIGQVSLDLPEPKPDPVDDSEDY